MRVELDAIDDKRESRALLHGLRASGRRHADHDGDPRLPAQRVSVRAAVLAAATAALALAVYGLARYPGLRVGGQPWIAGTVLIVVLLMYSAGALALSQGVTRQAMIARRHGVLGGVLIAAAWLVVLEPIGPLKPGSPCHW